MAPSIGLGTTQRRISSTQIISSVSTSRQFRAVLARRLPTNHALVRRDGFARTRVEVKRFHSHTSRARKTTRNLRPRRPPVSRSRFARPTRPCSRGPYATATVMNQLLPDRLKELWSRVDAEQLSRSAALEQQEQWLSEYRQVWTRALAMLDTPNLRQALMAELAAYLGVADIPALEARCRRVADELKGDWEATVTDPRDRGSVERFYDASQGYLLDLMWWHTLEDDVSPLAYVLALDFARRCPSRRYLDF